MTSRKSEQPNAPVNVVREDDSDVQTKQRRALTFNALFANFSSAAVCVRGPRMLNVKVVC